MILTHKIGTIFSNYTSFLEDNLDSTRVACSLSSRIFGYRPGDEADKTKINNSEEYIILVQLKVA